MRLPSSRRPMPFARAAFCPPSHPCDQGDSHPLGRYFALLRSGGEDESIPEKRSGRLWSRISTIKT
ncbi:hypothetical protein ACQKLN_23470 [Paenibacillus glucanolyticus]|uniref:hypothetical protein n=1 Tax=Paenibacillus glucanolyticus TaxID=59843 RepID=UPI003CFC1334